MAEPLAGRSSATVSFYVDYEGTEERQDSVTDTMVPDAAMRNGDFSGQSTILMNPSTGAPFAWQPDSELHDLEDRAILPEGYSSP